MRAGAGEFAQLLRDVAWLFEQLATELERATPPQREVSREGCDRRQVLSRPRSPRGPLSGERRHILGTAVAEQFDPRRRADRLRGAAASSIGRQGSEGRFIATWTERPERGIGPAGAECLECDRPAATGEVLPRAATSEGAGSVYEAVLASGVAVPLGAIASVDIGFVSGAYDFFILSPEDAERRGLPADVLTPTMRRPGDIPGLLASEGDVRLLLDLARRPEPSDDRVLAYLEEGETSGIPLRYKCRVRRPWYAVPLPRSKPDAFLPYMSHLAPRLIVNDVGAWSSNLLHGVTLGLLAPPPLALASAMASSITLLSAEIEGRAYGGGVLKLETRESERLLVPVGNLATLDRLAAVFLDIDTLVRGGDIETAARIADDAVGVDHDRIWGAYFTFRTRRLGRRRARVA